MMTWDWQSLLQQMNDAILNDPLVENYSLPPDLIDKGWIGYEPATEAQIAAVEKRLGKTLPPSYRAFLKVSNGWRVCNPYMDEVFPVEKIDFTRNTDLDLIELWESDSMGIRADRASVSDIAHTLRISVWTDMAVLLLNPQKTTPEGEWEAWFYTDNIPGAEVFPSFWDLMQDQLTGLLDAVESSVPSQPLPKKDQRKAIVDAIENIRQSWLMTSDYDEVQAEIDAIIARIQALPADNPARFQTELRELLQELKSSRTNNQATAQDLLTNLINSNRPTNTTDSMRQQAHLFIATVIEMYIE